MAFRSFSLCLFSWLLHGVNAGSSPEVLAVPAMQIDATGEVAAASDAHGMMRKRRAASANSQKRSVKSSRSISADGGQSQNAAADRAASTSTMLLQTRQVTQKTVGNKDLDASVLERVESRLLKLESLLGELSSAIVEDGVRVPTRISSESDDPLALQNLTVFERLRHMEHKIDGGLNWIKDPQLFEEQQVKCQNMSKLKTDHYVCFDKWEEILAKRQQAHSKQKCVVYDLGIRANPEFGVNMMKQQGCSVRAYDPSPTSQKWWENENGDAVVTELKAAGDDMYKLNLVGAGGTDGNIQLYEYNWQQVSIYRAENDVTARPKSEPDVPPQAFNLPVKTLRTMMLENGDSYIDVLKVDVEGSEYLFLQDMFDRMGCPPVGQLQLEWHHFSVDSRYGSPPEMNVLHNMLNSCGYKAFYNRDHWRAEPDYNQGARKIPPMRYTLAAYCKDCL